jgi:hypothetical protein
MCFVCYYMLVLSKKYLGAPLLLLLLLLLFLYRLYLYNVVPRVGPATLVRPETNARANGVPL